MYKKIIVLLLAFSYYYDRPRHPGDYHGHAPYLWCVNALLER